VFETTQDEGISRRIAANATWFAKLALRPLNRRETWRHIAFNSCLGFFVSIVYLHYIGTRSWYPEFHRVRLTFRDASLQAIPMGLGIGIFMYLSRIWSSRR
jgi:hypothetical protein